MDLRSYEEWKFELSATLRELLRLTGRPTEQQSALFRSLFARLAEDRFNITLVGRFSRGKTSLMNAILGMDTLPTGVVPLTSVITQVTYGSEPKAVLHYHHTSLFMDIPLRELPAHITERGNPGNHRGITVAEVQLPAEFLRRGFTFIDTPGIGSSIAANTRTTQSFLPEADAVILVTSHDSPLSEEEAGILAWAGGGNRPVFLVLNKQDMVDAEARAQALAHVTGEATRLGAGSAVRVFSVSSRAALAAKLARNAPVLAASGVPALESALVDFLVHDQRRAFLLGMCDRIAPLTVVPGAAETGQRLAALRARVTGVAVPAASASAATDPPLPATLQGCEVCAAIADSLFRYFARCQAELYGSPQARAQLAASGGFCRIHTQQFEAVAAPREASAALAPVLQRQADAVRRVAASVLPPARAAEAVAALLPEGLSCPACAVALRAESDGVSVLTGVVQRNGVPAAHERSALCLPHAARLAAVLPDPAASSQLLRRQAALLERLAEDASRYALKQDASLQGSLSTEEREAAWRAARVLLDAPQAQHGKSA